MKKDAFFSDDDGGAFLASARVALPRRDRPAEDEVIGAPRHPFFLEPRLERRDSLPVFWQPVASSAKARTTRMPFGRGIDRFIP